MSRNIYVLIMCLLSVYAIASAKILIIAETDYHDDPEGYNHLQQYIDDLEAEGETVDLYEHTHPGSGNTQDQCLPLYIRMVNWYMNSLGGDVVEGAVLVGNIPEPLMTYYAAGQQREDKPIDYYYMDLADSRTTPPSRYPNDGRNVWPFPTNVGGSIIDNFDKEHYAGDNIPEIWVSRVYARTILHYRDEGGDWGSHVFLTENEIIHQYFDRVHDWMTGRADVPDFGFAMGHIFGAAYDGPNPANAIANLRRYLDLERLDLRMVNYFAYPDNNPFMWQSQLQAGPYGNINKGAFAGEQYDPPDGEESYRDCRNPEYENDTRGYKWAGLKEHGQFEGNHFIDISGGNGEFNAICNVPTWQKVTTGGYNGSYYEVYNRDKWFTYPYLDKPNYAGINSVEWRFDVPATSRYEIYIYYTVSSSNSSNSWINILHGFDSSNKLDAFGIDQSAGTNGWNKIGRTYYLSANDVLRIQLAASGTETSNDRVIADAVKIVDIDATPPREWTIDNEDPEPAFHCASWWHRFFYSMRDDGGPSKTRFFITNTCSHNDYIVTDKVGLLYAMCDNGLISMGTSTWNTNSNRNEPFMTVLSQGKSFGEAYLEEVKEYNNFAHDKVFSLLGVGTLREKAYKPYVDYLSNHVFNENINTKCDYWVANIAILRNMNVLGSSPQTGDPELNLAAGNQIRIFPEFHAEYGCEMHLKIDASLQ